VTGSMPLLAISCFTCLMTSPATRVASLQQLALAARACPIAACSSSASCCARTAKDSMLSCAARGSRRQEAGRTLFAAGPHVQALHAARWWVSTGSAVDVAAGEHRVGTWLEVCDCHRAHGASWSRHAGSPRWPSVHTGGADMHNKACPPEHAVLRGVNLMPLGNWRLACCVVSA
jgi:hypothetical protein